MRKQKRVEIVFMLRSGHALHLQFEAIRHSPMMTLTATPQLRSRVDEPGCRSAKAITELTASFDQEMCGSLRCVASSKADIDLVIVI